MVDQIFLLEQLQQSVIITNIIADKRYMSLVSLIAEQLKT